jgi:multidrug resistance efflux pump
MKKNIILLFFILILTSCWSYDNKEKEKEKNTKQDFFVETKKISDFSNLYEIKKTWKIKSSQEITLSSKASWRVNKINVNFWENVYVGENLINLWDNISNYGLNLEKTNLSLESSKINYDSTKNSLDKLVNDNKINLEKLQKDYDILKKTIDENIKGSKLNLDQSKTSTWVITTTSIQIEKIDNNVKKAELDFENLKKSNIEQIRSFETTSENDFINLKNLYSDIINFSDLLLGVTEKNKKKNDDFEDFLWVKNSILKKETRKELLKLIEFNKDTFESNSDKSFSIVDMEKNSKIIETGFSNMSLFLDKLDINLGNSIVNIFFTQVQISWYKTQISWYKLSLAWKYSQFLSFNSNFIQFLNTYKNNENSTLEQINLLKKDRDLIIANLKINSKNAQISFNKIELSNQNSLNWIETSLKNSNLNLENAIKNRDITLRQLNNSIKMSQNTNSLANKQYNNLFISSPISWIITDILVDKWEDVNVWTNLIKLVSMGKNEVEIWLNFSEIKFIKTWDKVVINYLWEKLNWSINSISKVADSNLNYKTKISIDSKVQISWNIVEVIIPVKISKKLIPLRNLKVKLDLIWEINTLENNTLKKVLVQFWNFYWESVEIIWCKDLEDNKCDNLDVIVNDITNYDKEKFNIIKK